MRYLAPEVEIVDSVIPLTITSEPYITSPIEIEGGGIDTDWGD